jgi:hypothetical protein
MELGGKVNSEQKNYVLQNYRREKLLSLFNNWEETNNLILSIGAKTNVIVEFLIAELELTREQPKRISDRIKELGIAVLPEYLNSVCNEDEFRDIYSLWYDIASQGGFFLPGAPGILKRNQFGRLKVSTSPDKCLIYVDGDSRGFDAGRKLVVLVGKRIVRIRKVGYQDCVKTVEIKSNKLDSINCVLKTLENSIVASPKSTAIDPDVKNSHNNVKLDSYFHLEKCTCTQKIHERRFLRVAIRGASNLQCEKNPAVNRVNLRCTNCRLESEWMSVKKNNNWFSVETNAEGNDIVFTIFLKFSIDKINERNYWIDIYPK